MIRVNRQKLGQAVRYLKNSSGNTYKFLSQEVGVSDAVLCRIAKENVEIDFRTFSRLCEYLKVDPVSMLETSDEYLCLSRLPRDKREAVRAVLNGK